MSNGSEHMKPPDPYNQVDQEDLDAENTEGTPDPYQGDDWDGVQDSELADD